MAPRIGVLALQGDFQAHAASLARLGVESREVRRPAHLEGLHGVVLPGGESTTMWTFLDALDLGTALKQFAARGGALYGTCAGVILLARDIRNPTRAGLGLLDISIERNGYGRQTDSRILRVPWQPDRAPIAAAAMVGSAVGIGADLPAPQPASEPAPATTPILEVVLIRAPRILRTGPEVRCCLVWQDDPLWVEQGRIMGTTFHPELAKEDRFHQRFLELAEAAQAAMR